MLALCGPKRGEIEWAARPARLSSLIGRAGGAAHLFTHIAAGGLIVAESFRTGLGDLDIIGPREQIAELKVALAKSAPELSLEMLNTLRVEAGIPVFGVDMDENTIPNEAGLETRAISYEKGCYIGQETIARIKSMGHVNRHLVGVRLGAETSLLTSAATPKEKILVAGEEIGYITSAVASPRLGAIALGYVRRGHEQPGTRVVVAGQAAEISGLPFES
jgi:folate-binding protein YgfZ